MLTDATISDYEHGVRLPRLEWLHAYVKLCLRHRFPTATSAQLDAELAGGRACQAVGSATQVGPVKHVAVDHYL